MIIEVTTNKYAKNNPKQKLKIVRQFFMTNKDQWLDSDFIFKNIDIKNIRPYVNKLRCEGIPIVSDIKKGYKLTSDKTEIKKCYEDLRLRALRAYTAAKLMKKLI
jgi:hypothetical protein